VKRFLLLLCLSSLFLFCLTLNSYASVDISEIDSNIYKLYQKGVISEDLYIAVLNANNLKSGNIYSTRNELISGCNASNAIGYAILILNYNGYSSTGTGMGTPNLVILIAKGTIRNQTNDSSNTLYYNWNNLVRCCTYKWNGTNANYSSSSSGFYGNKGTPTWAYTTTNINTRTLQLNAYEEYGAYYLTSPLIWNCSTTSSINVTVNGFTKAIPLYKYSRSVNSFKLGYFTGWENQQIELSVGPYVSNDVVDVNWGKCQIDYYGNILNGNKIGFLKNGNQLEVWCSLPYYLYNQTYGIIYTYALQEDTSWSNDFYDFYILSYGSTQTSGELINSELDNNTDVGFINQIDYLLNSGDVTNYNSNSVFGFPSGLWSGDFSGDYGIITENFIDYDSKNFKIGTFFTNIIRNFINIFTTTENTTIIFGSASVSSASFDVLPSGLKVFISFIFNAICFLYILKYLYRVFYTISTFNLTQLLSDNSIDVSNFF